MIKKILKTLIPEKNRLLLRIALEEFRAPFYYGNNYFCICCERSFRKFLPKGNIKRLNAQCPYCGSLERSRLLLYYLKNETTLFESKLRLLHFAPERGLFKLFNNLDIAYVDGDLSPLNARNVIDMTNIDYPDDYFDLIICSHVLGHVPDEEKALSELFRVLKPTGQALILSLMNLESDTTIEDSKIVSAADRLKNYGEPDLCRLYGKDIAHRLAAPGFVVECIDYRNSLDAAIRERANFGDGSRELIYKCRKP